jgi:hypothetical protein
MPRRFFTPRPRLGVMAHRCTTANCYPVCIQEEPDRVPYEPEPANPDYADLNARTQRAWAAAMRRD